MFFLISGFVIPISLEKLSFTQFFISRIVRIYPVYIVSFFVGSLSLYVIGRLIVENFQYPHSLNSILIQVSLLRGWFWISSLDGLSWTLEIELIFYVITAFIFHIERKIPRFQMLKCCIVFFPFVSILCVEMIEKSPGAFQTYLLYLTFVMPFVLYMFIGTILYRYLKKQEKLASTIFYILYILWGFQVSLNAHSASYESFSFLLATIVFILFFFIT